MYPWNISENSKKQSLAYSDNLLLLLKYHIEELPGSHGALLVNLYVTLLPDQFQIKKKKNWLFLDGIFRP